MIPLGDIPAHHAARFGAGRVALCHGAEQVTWEELERRSTRRAWALRAAGVQPNDLVTLSLPNGAAIYEFTFAIWKLGATPHVVSWRLPIGEFKAILDVARPRLVIASDEALRASLGAKPAEFGRDTEGQGPVSEPPARHWKAISSGGSTGRPKVILDHTPALTDPEQENYTGIARDSVILNPGPLYHNAPFLFTHMALFRGCTVVGMAKFDAVEALRLIQDHGVRWVNFVPTMMSRIWRLPEAVRDRYDLSSLDRVWHMAAPMPPWLKEAWIDWLGPERIWELYGGTEGVGATIITGTEWRQHRGSVGKPKFCKIRILDEDRRDVATGTIGEVFFLPDSGVGATYHYLGADARRTADGWETIGDFGWLDGDGYLYIADRRTDLILAGGANIYPAEVEGALMEHPAVEVAVVIGLPDADLGASVHAIVKLADDRAEEATAADLAEFLGERLVRYKIPRSFEFTTEALRDDAGKVRRSSLREERLAPTPGAHL